MQSKDIYLTIDIGSSTIKAALFSDKGQLMVEDKIAISESFIHDYTQFKPSAWITKLCALITRITEKTEVLSKGKSKNKITSVCISGNGPTLVPLDYAGNTIENPLFWINNKTDKIKNCDSYFLAMVKKYKQESQSNYERTQTFLTVSEYIAYLLTGEKCTVIPSQEYTKYYWDTEQAEKYEVEIEKFAPFVTTGEEIGKVSRKGSKIFEISIGATVYAGAPDFISCLLGCGAVKKGAVVNRTGTSEAINTIVSAQEKTESDLPYLIKNTYIKTKYLENTGYQFDKYCKEKYGNNCDYNKIIEEILSEEEKSPEKSQGFSLLSQFATDFKEKYSSLESAKGKVVISGGQTLSAKWLDYKASQSSVKFCLPPLNAAELLGNLIIIKVAQAHYPDYKSAIADLVEYKNL